VTPFEAQATCGLTTRLGERLRQATERLLRVDSQRSDATVRLKSSSADQGCPDERHGHGNDGCWRWHRAAVQRMASGRRRSHYWTNGHRDVDVAVEVKRPRLSRAKAPQIHPVPPTGMHQRLQALMGTIGLEQHGPRARRRHLERLGRGQAFRRTRRGLTAQQVPASRPQR
jgi:hypothetical protein